MRWKAPSFACCRLILVWSHLISFESKHNSLSLALPLVWFPLGKPGEVSSSWRFPTLLVSLVRFFSSSTRIFKVRKPHFSLWKYQLFRTFQQVSQKSYRFSPLFTVNCTKFRHIFQNSLHHPKELRCLENSFPVSVSGGGKKPERQKVHATNDHRKTRPTAAANTQRMKSDRRPSARKVVNFPSATYGVQEKETLFTGCYGMRVRREQQTEASFCFEILRHVCLSVVSAFKPNAIFNVKSQTTICGKNSWEWDFEKR